MRVQIRFSTGGTFTDRFARSLIGKVSRFSVRAYEEGPVTADYGSGTIVAADLVEGGEAVLITYEGDFRADLPILAPGWCEFHLSSAGDLRLEPLPAFRAREGTT